MNKHAKVTHDEKKYLLSGGAKCTVIRHHMSPTYIASIEMDPYGMYPEEGHSAKNFNRMEYIYIRSGSMECKVNSQTYHMKKGESITLKNDESYSLSAGAEGLNCIVLVTDGDNAESIITKN